MSPLEARAKAQRDTANQSKVFHLFQLRDQVTESGITFVNCVVDDAARFHKPVHYDHGTGIAAADAAATGSRTSVSSASSPGSQLERVNPRVQASASPRCKPNSGVAGYAWRLSLTM